jgi:hypothetical protein
MNNVKSKLCLMNNPYSTGTRAPALRLNTSEAEPPETFPFVLRGAVPTEADQIASLFRMAYRESSHPCKETHYIESTFQTGCDSWYVAVKDDQVLGCTASRLQQWNGAYEMCRSITLPEYRGYGLGTRLYAKSLEESCRRQDCDLTVGFPRTYAMYRLMTKDIRPAFVLVGHDGAMNIANGHREYHLLGLTSNGREPLRRVVPFNSALATSRFVQEEIVEPLGVESHLGDYPSAYVVGSGAGKAVRAGKATFRVEYDPSSPSQALEITGIAGPRLSSTEVSGAFSELLQTYRDARHVSAYVLVDKERLIRDLAPLGFAITAYLPAWHKVRGKRYDAVLLCRRTCAESPAMHETQEIIGKFDHAYADLGQSASDAVSRTPGPFLDPRSCFVVAAV